MSTYTRELEVDFSNISAPNKLNYEMRCLVEDRDWCDILLKCVNTTAYPNTCTPIAGIIEHYREKGVDIKCDWTEDERTYLGHTRVQDPFVVDSDEGSRRLRKPFDVVWRVSDPLEIRDLVDAVRTEACERSDVEKGVLTGIEWCLYEVMDNVLQHSEIGHGLFMGQYVESNSRLSLCVFDGGIGIYNSLRGSRHSPASPLDAITKALQERVTRDEAIGQGNGMWGLSEVVRRNGGRYRISSHGANVFLVNGTVRHHKSGGFFFGTEGLGTTLVDFQIDCTSRIDVAQALNHDPVRLWLEDLENDEGSEYVIRIADRSEGTGTRMAAKRVRHLAVNVAREGGQRVVFDFDGIGTVSSSYADELVGKLLAETGFLTFMNRFRLTGVSTLNQQVINRSVQQRMAQEYYNEPSMDD